LAGSDGCNGLTYGETMPAIRSEGEGRVILGMAGLEIIDYYPISHAVKALPENKIKSGY